jgi:hypothetical protein
MADSDWFTLVQTVGIIASLLFTAYELRRNRASCIAANEIKLIELHRDLWRMTIDQPSLMRPFGHDLKPDELKLSIAESRFVNLLFLHISGAFRLTEAGEVRRTGDFRGDLKELLARPAIRNFWEANQRYHDARFVAFVNSCAPRVEIAT